MAIKVPIMSLNDGYVIPALGIGTSNSVTKSYEEVKHALQLGYRHINITESEELVGIRHAIEESGIPRHEIFITAKVYILEEMGTVISNALLSLGGTYVDLYLMDWEPYDHPLVLFAAWRVMERIKKSGQAKSIGVANMGIHDLKSIIERAEYFLPAINQVKFQSYYPQNHPLEWTKMQGIVTASYGSLDSLGRIENRGRSPFVEPESTLPKRVGNTNGA
ncbi:hypothetical protein IFR05_001877 [Cadophora sp. M221]|nr:hypothetical protein IFR05_001877 [Cadophora sp. M221]